MGEVYRAKDLRLGRDVAIKVLPNSFVTDVWRLQRFEQEARAAATLNHPNILAVYDIGTYVPTSVEGATALATQECPYIVSELLEGQTLRERLSGGALPVRKAIDYAQQITRGLAAAHDKGIVHRDLKPENIFVTNDGRIKILDFGLAKLTRPEISEGVSITQTIQSEAGTVLGTVGYMSPEQVRGIPTDARSDLFSVGVILYEMLSGKRAFKGESAAETMSAILKEEPPELAETNRAVPPALERIVRHCLEKNPVERFQSARDVAFDLEMISSESAPASTAKAAIHRNKHFAWWVALGILVTAAILAAFVLGKSSARDPVPPSYHQLTFQRGLVSSALFGPDGHTIVYAAAWEAAPLQLFSTRDEARGSLSLGLKNADVEAISPSGEVAVLMDQRRIIGWARMGTLAMTSVNGGAPRPIVENAAGIAWTPDGSGFAVVRYTGQHFRLEYPSGKQLFATSGWISSPRFSPKGDQIAFIHHPVMGDDRGEVAVVDLAGHSRVLAAGFASAQGLAWMPSKNEIWFTASDTGTLTALRAVTAAGASRVIARAPGRLHLLDIANDGRVLLTQESARRAATIRSPLQPTERDLALLDWSLLRDISQDGQNILITEEGEGGGPNYSVYLRNINDATAIRLGDGDGWAISPDGKWALATSMTSPRSVYLLPTGAGEPKMLNAGQIHFESGTFSPDGKLVVFSGIDPSGGRHVYSMDLNGGAPRAITPAGLHGLSAERMVSPDGKTILATDDVKWWLYPINGGEGRPVLGLRPDDYISGWTPGGKSVYASDEETPPAKVFRVDLVTGRREFCCQFAPSDTAGVFALGPIILTQNKDLYGYGFGRITSALYVMDAPK
jgi:serine/threonine protein kinase